MAANRLIFEIINGVKRPVKIRRRYENWRYQIE